jgi:carbon-monoxide dehydrogenase catalytic subunit
MGVDNDWKSLLMAGMRCALSDGWGGSMIATEISDILFGCPTPRRSKANLGVLRPKEVNLVLHGHVPLLSDLVARVARSRKMQDLARERGAEGINVTGICCTANEVLIRDGIPVHSHRNFRGRLGNFRPLRNASSYDGLESGGELPDPRSGGDHGRKAGL